MRVSPIMLNYDKSRNIAVRGQNNASKQVSKFRNYTGEASHDLAVASIYDKNIARELKLMGLI